jgi:uncharacterized repeat protein (TIGR03803 family)
MALQPLASRAQIFNSLVSFDYSDGEYPYSSLVQGPDGRLYGTTTSGGENSEGTVFAITSSGELHTVYSFCPQSGCSDGSIPYAGLIETTDGTFYGTTAGGGNNNSMCALAGCGTVFKITRQGKLTTLYRFCAQAECADGSLPYGLMRAIDGDFYGTTYFGGTNGNYGTVFKLTPGGKLTTLYSFCGQTGCTDGKNPSGPLMQAGNGKLYGTTGYGGSTNTGVVFAITQSGKLRTLYSFCAQENCADGEFPEGGLIQGNDGNLYGETSSGGAHGSGGTVFRISKGGELTTLYSFCAQGYPYCTDGQNPQGQLVQTIDGNLYGATEQGGGYAVGTIFSLSPLGQLTTLHSFCGEENCLDGRLPTGGVLQSTDGNFYGTTINGGNYSGGVVFTLNMGLTPFVTFVVPYGRVGQSGGILGQGFAGTTSVTLNGVPASFTVKSDTYLVATIPPGATTGYVTVTTPTGTLTSNKKFVVLP